MLLAQRVDGYKRPRPLIAINAGFDTLRLWRGGAANIELADYGSGGGDSIRPRGALRWLDYPALDRPEPKYKAIPIADTLEPPTPIQGIHYELVTPYMAQASDTPSKIEYMRARRNRKGR